MMGATGAPLDDEKHRKALQRQLGSESDYKSRGKIEVTTQGERGRLEDAVDDILSNCRSIEDLSGSMVWKFAEYHGIKYMTSKVYEAVKEELEDTPD